MKRILYIQHAGGLGGSCMSLLYLIQGLDRSIYEPVVACIHNAPEVIDLYKKNNIEAFYWPGITPLEHTTLGWGSLTNPLGIIKFIRQMIHFQPAAKATEALVEQVKPDVVHLNSLVLAPSAAGVKQTHVPLVWHVREPVAPGYFGLRKGYFSRLFMRFADEGVFISHYDRQQLTGGKKGRVVHNFIDFSKFERSMDGSGVRKEVGLPANAKVILFLGGQSVVKGIFPLLRAMALVKQGCPEAHLLVGAGAYHFSGRVSSRIARTILPLIGSGTVAQRVDKLIRDNHLQNTVHLLEWRSDIPQLVAACDVLVFPSIEPHFARPVIEAGAMGKPVVASRIGGVEELVEDGQTGILVSPNNPSALAQALVDLLTHPDKAARLGEQGVDHAKSLFNAETNIRATVQIYKDLLQLDAG